MDEVNLSDALARNRRATARIADIAAGPDDLSRVIHDRWTVGAKLGHLAFWDRFVLGLLDRWQAGMPFRFDNEQWQDDSVNDAILDESLALDPTVAKRLAAEAARLVDDRLGGLDAVAAARLEADAANPETDANWLVHRYRHREEHLEEIEVSRART